jgi:hypothetical protein
VHLIRLVLALGDGGGDHHPVGGVEAVIGTISAVAAERFQAPATRTAPPAGWGRAMKASSRLGRSSSGTSASKKSAT